MTKHTDHQERRTLHVPISEIVQHTMMTLSLYNRILLFWLIRSSWILTDFSNGETPTGCICIDESCHYFNCPDNSNVNNDRNNNNDDRMLCRKKDQLLEDLKNVRFPMTLLDATEVCICAIQ